MQPVARIMRSPVHRVREDESLADAERRMIDARVSALVVVDETGELTGVLSRIDLLRAGRMRRLEGRRERLLSLPDARVRELMTAGGTTVDAAMPVSEAARKMARERLHRVIVVDRGGRPAGVVSTHEAMEAVVLARLETPIADIMREGVVIVRAGDPLRLALDRLVAAHHVGLVVEADGWPVGVFTGESALLARDAPPDDPVEEWMDHAILCLPSRMPAHRAAQQALATHVGVVLAVDAEGVSGVVTGFDFAELLWRTARAAQRSPLNP